MEFHERENGLYAGGSLHALGFTVRDLEELCDDMKKFGISIEEVTIKWNRIRKEYDYEFSQERIEFDRNVSNSSDCLPGTESEEDTGDTESEWSIPIFPTDNQTVTTPYPKPDDS